MPVQIQLRRGILEEWIEANPILALGELSVETDTGKFKIGDGVKHWVDLPYSSGLKGDKGEVGDYHSLDGGTPNSVYGGAFVVDGGGVI